MMEDGCSMLCLLLVSLCESASSPLTSSLSSCCSLKATRFSVPVPPLDEPRASDDVRGSVDVALEDGGGAQSND
jgi:hypothetical protein